MTKPQVYIALLHYPVYNKHMEIVTTSITNLDVHDIARSARTYNVEQYYIVHPVEAQKQLIDNMLVYWREGYGAEYNPDRKAAFDILTLIDSLEEAMSDIESRCGKKPKLVTTDARIYPNTLSYKDLREKIWQGDEAYLVIFGTGYGIQQETMNMAEHILEPILGGGEYNHLCVRGAVSIILDRLLGEPWWEGSQVKETAR